MEIFLHSIIHALKDGLLSIPILYLAYLLMELLERSKKLDENIMRRYSRRAGPAIGGLLGAVPQCGISGAAATMFSTGAITAGTMLAVFFATSDEMLPVMLSSMTGENGIGIGKIFTIVGIKVVIGVVLGYIVDAVFGKLFSSEKNIHTFCEREHCDCDDEGNIWLAALHHTLLIGIMLIVVNALLNLALNLVGVEKLSSTVFSKPVAGELLLALFGLIPNCSISVVITEAYLNNIIGLGGLFSGLLANAGIGLLVLFRSNKNMRENMYILGILFVLSAVTGIIIGFIA